MRTYLAFIDEDPAGFGVVFPDLAGCVAVGDSFEDAMAKGGEALALYAQTLRTAGQAMPGPRTRRQIEAAKLDWIEPGYVVAAIPLFAARRQTARAKR
ncbi:MAG: type II toxin-antitoxin system HicB family antitoxin [Reyranellaceae bacterium]